MYLKYGNYQHAANEASVVITKQALFSEAGLPRGTLERWSIQGQLHAADGAGLTVAIGSLQAAYAIQGQDVGFYFDDGQPTSHRIQSAATNGGVRVAAPPSFPQGRGAEYTTFRNYTITLEAEWLDAQASLLSWHEVLQFRGGGPQFGFLEPINGLPVKQLLKQATTYQVTQSGAAVGYLAYPVPAGPLWPQAEQLERREVRYETPRRLGPPGNPTFSHYRVSWSYSFADAGPLFGLPSSWPL